MEVDGVKLRQVREEQAYSLRALAEISGVAYATIFRIESGKTGARPSTLRKLAQALKVEPRELMKR